MRDEEIIKLYNDRNEQAINETKARFGRLLGKIVANILDSKEDAEECENDTFMALWNAIPPAEPESLTAFVARVARNQALKKLEYMNREKRSAVTVPIDELSEVLPDDRSAPGTDAEGIGALISSFLRIQKRETREVFIRRYFMFESVKDIAEHFSFSESKVKNMLFNTRKKLKDYLIKEGVEL